MEFSFSERIRTAESVLIQQIQNEIIFLNMETEAYLGLDEVGSHMFRVLNSSESIQSAYTTLLQEYDVGGDRLCADLQDLITKMLDKGLVRIVRA